MYWYKVKTLLIALFAVINVFLIAFIVHGKVRQDIYEKNEIQSLISVLKDNKIEVDDDILKVKAREIETATVENLTPSGDELAKKLLGSGYETVDGTPVNYVLGSKKVYVNGGKLYYKDESKMPDKTISEDKISVASDFLTQLGINTGFAEGKIAGEKIVFTYYFNKIPLFENTLYLKMNGSNVVEMGGYVIGFKELDGKTIQIANVRNALIDFLRDGTKGDEKQKIISVSLGYSALLADSSVHFKNTETIPTYKITTDKNKVYYYDAR